MEDFFKYLTPGKEDKRWGLFLNVAGKSLVPPHSEYPKKNHPPGYYFTWDTGRVLEEYQIHYITMGKGIYENTRGKYRVKPGSLIITKPGVWHRFRPDRNTGWQENYIGFNGSIAQDLFRLPVFSSKKPIRDIGNREEIIDTYHKIFEFVLEEKPGFQQVAAGMIMKLLGYLIATEKQRDFSDKHVEKIIKNARFRIRENVEKNFDFKKYAEDNNISYSYFRKMFKKYNDCSPGQYLLELKILKAKDMLLSTNKIVKEISYELGFSSVYYFSRMFKSKTGKSPSEIRKLSINKKKSSS